jgi:DNA-binding transcriptional ArsR family regulator
VDDRVGDDVADVVEISTPEQFRALGHPMRHRLLFALGRGQATISQLAATLDCNKGSVAYHLGVLASAGLVRRAGARQVRGGTEQYYERAFRLRFDDAGTMTVAFQALAAEIAAAEPDPFVVVHTLKLSDDHARRVVAILRDLAQHVDDDGDDTRRYGLLLGFYQPRQGP